jgi:hypothetical protein
MKTGKKNFSQKSITKLFKISAGIDLSAVVLQHILQIKEPNNAVMLLSSFLNTE